MRDYGSVHPSYWTGPTGRQIRALGQDAQLVGLYLLTAPAANMIGLYYLPLVILAHETNCTVDEARGILASLSEIDFAHYDEGQETVWVTRMAFFQVGDHVEPRDNRWPALIRELLTYTKSRFYSRFMDLYSEPFHLMEALEGSPSKDLQTGRKKGNKAPSKGLPSPFEASPKTSSNGNEAPSVDSADLEQAPPKPTNRNRNNEQEQRTGTGTTNNEQGAAAPPPCPPAVVPGWLQKDLASFGLTATDQAQLLGDLGLLGLRAAVLKVQAQKGVRKPSGLLMSRASELAEQGRGMLQGKLSAALEGAPHALQDPRWANLPPELRGDPEVQAAWANWIRVEELVQASRDIDALPQERAARQRVLDLLVERHPDPEALKARLDGAIERTANFGLQPRALRLAAQTSVLGLAPNHASEGK